jgi:toxin ParE1/3/4
VSPRSRAYQVRWSAGAIEDVAAIAEHVERESPERAAEEHDELIAAAAQLAALPMRGRVVPELHEMGIDLWRELIVGPYRILYRVQSRRVLVSLVLDGRRDIEHVLLEHLIGR